MNEKYNIDFIEDANAKIVVSHKNAIRKLFFVVAKQDIFERDLDHVLIGAHYFSSIEDAKNSIKNQEQTKMTCIKKVHVKDKNASDYIGKLMLYDCSHARTMCVVKVNDIKPVGNYTNPTFLFHYVFEGGLESGESNSDFLTDINEFQTHGQKITAEWLIK